jgi:tRNA(fMet)-specific endonuclease VapC
MLCLDTNIAIAIIARRDHRMGERFRSSLSRGLALPVHVVSELWFGVWNSTRVTQNTERLSLFLSAPLSILAFDAQDAAEAGMIRANLKESGTPIGAYDLLIATQARRRGLPLATLNAQEFRMVPGLIVEDWSQAA